MRKLVLTGICALAGALALGCSSQSANKGAPFDNGVGAGGASSGPGGNTGTQAAPYPAGPYGYEIGSILGPGTQFFYGLKDPAKVGYDVTNLQKIYLSDLYDPDGKKGTKLIMLNVSARWCTVCQGEYQTLDFPPPPPGPNSPPNCGQNTTCYKKYQPLGVQFFGVLFEDIDQNPAQPNDLHLWTRDYQVQFPMVLDPSFWFGHFFTADATPMNLFVNPKNMKIVAQVLGEGSSTASIWDQLDSTLAKMK